jgi:hypothetical protein
MTKARRFDGPSDAVKLRVLKRDRFTCVYCGVAGTEAELEVDHVHPVSKGGSHHIGNLVTACRSCNQKKSDGSLDRQQGAARSGSKPAGLVGMFLHTFNERGLHYQGQIIGTDGDLVLVQLFSWMTGDATTVEPMTKEFLYSEKCKLYAHHDRWTEAAESVNYRRGAA